MNRISSHDYGAPDNPSLTVTISRGTNAQIFLPLYSGVLCDDTDSICNDIVLQSLIQ